MNEEINIKIPGQILDYVDTKEHLLELYNYITNLQHTKEYLGEVLHEQDLKLEDYKSRVENVIYDYTSDVYEELEDYKSRVEKAVEYVKDRFDEDKGMWIIDCYELLDILNGKE